MAHHFGLAKKPNIVFRLRARGQSYLEWAEAIYGDEKLSREWGWYEAGNMEYEVPQRNKSQIAATREFGAKMVATFADMANAVKQCEGWFMFPAGRRPRHQLLGDALRTRRITGVPWVGYNTLQSPFLKPGLADALRKGAVPVEPFNAHTPPQTASFPPVAYTKDVDVNGEISHGETIYPVLSDLWEFSDPIPDLKAKCEAIPKTQINLCPDATGFLFWDLGEEDCERQDGGQWLPWDEIDRLHEFLASVGVADGCITVNGDKADQDKATRLIEANPPVPVICMKNSGGTSDFLAARFEKHIAVMAKLDAAKAEKAAKKKRLNRLSLERLVKLAEAMDVDRDTLRGIWEDDGGDRKTELVDLIIGYEEEHGVLDQDGSILHSGWSKFMTVGTALTGGGHDDLQEGSPIRRTYRGLTNISMEAMPQLAQLGGGRYDASGSPGDESAQDESGMRDIGSMITVIERDPESFTPREMRRYEREKLMIDRRWKHQYQLQQESLSKQHGDYGPTWKSWSEEAVVDHSYAAKEWLVPENADPQKLVVVDMTAKDVGRTLATQMQMLMAHSKTLDVGGANEGVAGAETKRIQRAWSWHFELYRLSEQQMLRANLYGFSILGLLLLQTVLAVTHAFYHPENACGNALVFCPQDFGENTPGFEAGNQTKLCDPQRDFFNTSLTILPGMLFVLALVNARQKPRQKAHDLMYASKRIESEIYCYRARALHYAPGGTLTWASVLHDKNRDGELRPSERFEMILEDVRFALDWDENLAPGKSPPSFADFAEAGLAREGRLFGGWEAPHFTRMELEASAQCETRRQIRLDNEEIFAIQKADAALAAARRAGDERAILAAEEAVRAKLQLRTELEKLSLNALKTRAEIRGCPDDEIDEEALSGVDNPKVALVEVIMAHVDILWLQKAAEKTLGTKGTKALWKEVALLKGKRVIAPRHRSLSDLIFVILSRQSDAKAIERDDGFAMISSEKYAYYRLERTLKEVQTHTERLSMRMQLLQVLSYALLSSSVLMSILNHIAYMAILISAFSATQAISTLQQLQERIVALNQSHVSLSNHLLWWGALSPGERFMAHHSNALVAITERGALMEAAVQRGPKPGKGKDEEDETGDAEKAREKLSDLFSDSGLGWKEKTAAGARQQAAMDASWTPGQGGAVAVACAWALPLSSTVEVIYGEGSTTALRTTGNAARGKTGTLRAVCVAVPRGRRAPPGGFVLSIDIDQMPSGAFGTRFSFGVGRSRSPHDWFGLSEHSCGLYQNLAPGCAEDRCADANDFGKRQDNLEGSYIGSRQLQPEIKKGVRLSLQLSSRGAQGFRTARFFADGAECAAFEQILDEALDDDDWVAGVTLPPNCQIRIVDPDAAEVLGAEVAGHEEKQRLSFKAAAGVVRVGAVMGRGSMSGAVNFVERKTGLDLDGDGDVGVDGTEPEPEGGAAGEREGRRLEP